MKTELIVEKKHHATIAAALTGRRIVDVTFDARGDAVLQLDDASTVSFGAGGYDGELFVEIETPGD